MSSVTACLAVVAVAVGAKLLLFPTYRSTDFEVHRNWLAITHSLPLQQWYVEATSQWTLDYPPFFAWFEWALSQVAVYFDPEMLKISNQGYASPNTVLFQRLTVVVTDVTYMTAAWALARLVGKKHGQGSGITLFMLLTLNAGLLLVDHIHFQYNGFVIGVLLWSLYWLMTESYWLAGVAYTCVVHLKHLYVYCAPIMLVYILRRWCGPSLAGISRFFLMAVTVAGISALSLGPFWREGQIMQLMSRLFPFGRGLTHSYWAANSWALYSGADKVLAVWYPHLKRDWPDNVPAVNTASGQVGIGRLLVLPPIGPQESLALVAIGLLPPVLALLRKPQAVRLPSALAYVLLTGFWFGYHVHEKAILPALLPLTVTAVSSRSAAQDWLILAAAGHAGLLPLLPEPEQYPVKILLCLAYWLLAAVTLSAVHSTSDRCGAPEQTSDTSITFAPSAFEVPGAASSDTKFFPQPTLASPSYPQQPPNRFSLPGLPPSATHQIHSTGMTESGVGYSAHRVSGSRPLTGMSSWQDAPPLTQPSSTQAQRTLSGSGVPSAPDGYRAPTWSNSLGTVPQATWSSAAPVAATVADPIYKAAEAPHRSRSASGVPTDNVSFVHVGVPPGTSTDEPASGSPYPMYTVGPPARRSTPNLSFGDRNVTAGRAGEAGVWGPERNWNAGPTAWSGASAAGAQAPQSTWGATSPVGAPPRPPRPLMPPLPQPAGSLGVTSPPGPRPQMPLVPPVVPSHEWQPAAVASPPGDTSRGGNVPIPGANGLSARLVQRHAAPPTSPPFPPPLAPPPPPMDYTHVHGNAFPSMQEHGYAQPVEAPSYHNGANEFLMQSYMQSEPLSVDSHAYRAGIGIGGALETAARGAPTATKPVKWTISYVLGAGSLLHPLAALYVVGFLPLEIYCSAVHSMVFEQRLPFLPLMLTSLYCALGLGWVWLHMALGYVGLGARYV